MFEKSTQRKSKEFCKEGRNREYAMHNEVVHNVTNNIETFEISKCQNDISTDRANKTIPRKLNISTICVVLQRL